MRRKSGHSDARDATIPEESIETFFATEPRWNEKRKRLETYSATHGVFWYWKKLISCLSLWICPHTFPAAPFSFLQMGATILERIRFKSGDAEAPSSALVAVSSVAAVAARPVCVARLFSGKIGKL
ncbi:MAG: hypothetical protein HYY30_12855 [Chloroflexi bacterium]|nr:hypothetical protein [Chloroflexota bacterium]